MNKQKATQPIKRSAQEKELIEKRRQVIKEINQFLEAENETQISDEIEEVTEDNIKPYNEEQKEDYDEDEDQDEIIDESQQKENQYVNNHLQRHDSIEHLYISNSIQNPNMINQQVNNLPASQNVADQGGVSTSFAILVMMVIVGYAVNRINKNLRNNQDSYDTYQESKLEGPPDSQGEQSLIEQVSQVVGRMAVVPQSIAMNILTRMDTHESMHDDMVYDDNHIQANRDLMRAQARQPVVGDQVVFETNTDMYQQQNAEIDNTSEKKKKKEKKVKKQKQSKRQGDDIEDDDAFDKV